MGSTIRRHNIDGHDFLRAEDVIEETILTLFYMGRDMGFSFQEAMKWYQEDIPDQGLSYEFDVVVKRMLSYADVGDALKELDL